MSHEMASDFFNPIFWGSCGQIFLFVTRYQSLQFRHVSTLKSIVGVKRPNWPKLFLSSPSNHIQKILGKKKEQNEDVTWYTIKLLEKLGLAYDLKYPYLAPAIFVSRGKGCSMIRTTMGLDKFRTPKIGRYIYNCHMDPMADGTCEVMSRNAG